MAAQHTIARTGALPSATGSSWFKRSTRILGRDWPIAYVFFLPTALLLFGLIGYPFVRALFLSFFNVVGVREGAFVGLQNYANLKDDDFFRRSIVTTAEFTFFSEVFKFALGLSVALLLHNLPRWGSVLGGIVLLPYIIPEIVRALAWRILLDPLFGALNYILVNVLHVMTKGPSWLADTGSALPSVVTVNVWSGIPFFVILLLAGLKSIDKEVYEAAAVDGANAWRRFLHVTLPGFRLVAGAHAAARSRRCFLGDQRRGRDCLWRDQSIDSAARSDACPGARNLAHDRRRRPVPGDRHRTAAHRLSLLFYFRDRIQEHASDPADPEHVLAIPMDARTLRVSVHPAAICDVVRQHHSGCGGQYHRVAVCGEPGRLRAGAVEMEGDQSAQHRGAGCVLDAARADVHSAVRHLEPAQGDQH